MIPHIFNPPPSPPILPTPPFLWEKSETHPFFQKLQKLKLPSFIKGEGEGSNYEQFSNYLTSASEFSLMADNTTNTAN